MFVSNDGSRGQRYIYFNKQKSTYSWNLQSEGNKLLPQQEDLIKQRDLWPVVRDYYIEKKNVNDDPNVHSRTYALTINKICQRYGLLYKIEK